MKFTTWVEIKKQAILYNLRQFRKLIGPKVKLMAVVKSEAYGHGMIKVARIVQKGADWLAIVNLQEALGLRKAGIKAPVLVLSYWQPDLANLAIKKNIDLVVYSLAQAKLLSRLAKKLKKKAFVHIKVDTGTSRMGISVDKALEFFRKIKKLPGVEIRGVFTHYASSEEYNQTYTNWQTERFKKLLNQLEKEGSQPLLVHAACSASTIVNPGTHFDMARIGISMYGLWPSEETERLAKAQKIPFKLKPVLSWYARIVQIKTLPKNTCVGYGCTYKTKKKTKIAIVPVGYYEGYDRHLSKKGEVLIHGRRCKLLGQVCMNLTIVDVTRISNVRVGDRVVLIGKDRKEKITAKELAKKIGTINYEIVSRINPNIPRIYV